MLQIVNIFHNMSIIELMKINGTEFFTIKEIAEKTGKEYFAVKQALFRAGIKPLARDALYSNAALDAIRDIKIGRPKKADKPPRPRKSHERD
jgi:hypothetical protein